MAVKLTARQIGEFESRDFLGEDTWKRWKLDYDNCMAWRKTLNGKPDDYDRLLIRLNHDALELYGSNLFHSVSLAKEDMCACTHCGQNRKTKS